MNDQIQAGSFYIGSENIGWSIVEKETGVYKSGLMDKNSITYFLNSNQLTFMMCDYIIFNLNSQVRIFKKEIVDWFCKKAPLVFSVITFMEEIKNPLDVISASELQATNWFKEHKGPHPKRWIGSDGKLIII